MKNITIYLLFALLFQFSACKKDSLESLISVNATPILLMREAGEFTLPVEHNVEFEVDIIEGANWISRKQSKSMTNTDVIFIHKENDTGKSRDGKIEIKGSGIKEVITVTQSIDSYIEDTRKVLNPDIGFYKAFQIQIADDDSDAAFLSQSQLEQTAYNHSIVHLRFGLQAFSTNGGGSDKDLPANVLMSIDKTFANLRRTNASAIIRFSYDVTGQMVNGQYKNNEPSMEMIKKHISQIGRIVNTNLDVISGIETGMLGPWGEQHSTTMSNNDINYYHLVKAWLDNTTDIGITVRTPSHFMKWLNRQYSLSYTPSNIGSFDIDTNPSVVDKERARRVGCYNDGYLGSESDLGTFQNRTQEVMWLSKAAKYSLYGGEVVADWKTGNLGQYNQISFLEVEGFQTRTAYLNIDWNYEFVIKKWQNLIYSGIDALYNNGITSDFNFVENRLGYRLFLSTRSVDEQINISKGEKIKVVGVLNNVGFANVVNKKKVQIVLDNGTNKHYIETDFNISLVEPKEQKSFNFELDLPSDIVVGKYQIYMKISSVYEKEVSNKRTIEFANSSEFWNENLGANLLGTVQVVN